MTPRLHASFVLCLVATSAWAQVPAGGETRVNTFTTGWQFNPSVALEPSGAYMVVWEAQVPDGDGSGRGVFGQRYDAGGPPRGGPFQVNTVTFDDQFGPTVAARPGGGFVVAWSSWASGTPQLVLRRYDAAGAALGAEGRVNTFTTDAYNTGPSIAFDAKGGMVITWRANRPGTPREVDVWARRYDASGAALGEEFRVNATTADCQENASVARAPAGDFVVAWSSYDCFAPISRQAFGRRFDAAGNPLGGDFRFSSSPGGQEGNPSVAMSPGGGFVVAWPRRRPGWDLAVRRFDAAGVPREPELFLEADRVDGRADPLVVSDAAGGFVVAWKDYWGYLHPQGFDTIAARFDSSGHRRGPDFLVNTYTSNYQYPGSVASDPSGNFIVTWHSFDQVGLGFDVFTQRYGGLLPSGARVDTAGNLVWEPGETIDVRPSWRNVSGAARTMSGSLALLSGPAGATYTIVDGTGAYGTLADGATVPCTDCYAVAVSAPAARPAVHWDAVAEERLAPDAQGQVKEWPLHIGGSFGDVPPSSPFYRFVETLLHRGVSGGCAAGAFCPSASATREQMAVFLLAAREGSAYLPPACGTPRFTDVPASSPFCRWVEELARRGVTSGCGTGYCPADPVTREQMAVFLLRTLDPSLDPPACTAPTVFADVPASSPFCRWIEELSRRGISGGCGGGNYCPSAAVTREQMAAFLSTTFGLSLYGL